MECIRPEFGRETGATKHSTNGFTDGMVGTFTWTIMMRRIGCSRFDSIARLFKQINDFGTKTKFTTEIKSHIFVRNILGKAMLYKPTVKEIDGQSFGAKTFTIQHAAEMIGNEAITCFTINAFEAMETTRVRGALDNKAKINGNTLITDSHMMG